MTAEWSETLTKTERGELRSLARRRAKVAKADIEARQAQLLAEVEEQLAHEFKREDERWQDIVREAERACDDANRRIRAACEEAGVPTEFAPSLQAQWYARGTNGIAGRRSELRKVATTRLAQMAKDAKAAVDRRTVEIETRLASTALQSNEAAEWLATLPQIDDLLTALSVDDVRAELGTGGAA